MMIVALAQTRPHAGQIARNLQDHLRLADKASAAGAHAVFFSELSLTGYEPTLAQTLALTLEDSLWETLRSFSKTHKIAVSVGFPLRTTVLPTIANMLILPDGSRQLAQKAHLHPDEVSFFQPGPSCDLVVNGIHLGFALCYELSVPGHADQAFERCADAYIASVAKHRKGVEQASEILAAVARRFRATCMFVNAVGFSDQFLCAGATSIFNGLGEVESGLSDQEEGLVFGRIEPLGGVTLRSARQTSPR